MKLKKAVALLCTTGMLMGVLSGCGGSDAGSASSTTTQSPADTGSSQDSADTVDAGNSGGEVEKVSLKIWAPEEEQELTQKMCEAFNEAHPEFDCTFEIAVVGNDESINKLETDPDLAADVFLCPSGGLSQLKDAGLIYPITANIDEVKPLYGEGAIDACTRDDYLYGIPQSPNTFFMYYNKSMYTDDEVKSLETMMAKDLGSDVYNFSYTVHDSWYLEAFFYAAGCTLFGPDGEDPTECSWASADGVDAVNYVINLVNNPKYIEDRDGVAGSLFKEGKLGALCSGTWADDDGAFTDALGDDLGACALPTINLNGKDCQLSNFADYRCYAVKSSTAHPMAAQLLAEYLGNEENQLQRYKECKVSPTCLSLQESPELADDVVTCGLLAQTQFATPQPSISQISNYWTPVATLGESILQGDVNSTNIQESLNTVVDTILSTLTE